RLTVFVEAFVYRCVRGEAIVFVVLPSPKSHSALVIVPLELLVKLTSSGLRPAVGPPAKLAAGTNAPVPVTTLVVLPSLPVVKWMLLLTEPALVGAKRTTRLVEPNPARPNGVPETIVKAVEPLPKVATPFVSGAPPKFVTMKLA